MKTNADNALAEAAYRSAEDAYHAHHAEALKKLRELEAK